MAAPNGGSLYGKKEIDIKSSNQHGIIRFTISHVKFQTVPIRPEFPRYCFHFIKMKNKICTIICVNFDQNFFQFFHFDEIKTIPSKFRMDGCSLEFDT